MAEVLGSKCLNNYPHPEHTWTLLGDPAAVHTCPGTGASFLEVTARQALTLEGFPLGRRPELRPPTDVDYITSKLLAEIESKMLKDANEYGTTNHRVLGEKGQFADIWRKIGKLKRAMWEDADTSDWRESPRTIAMDLIGHLLLTIAMWDRAEEAE